MIDTEIFSLLLGGLKKVAGELTFLQVCVFSIFIILRLLYKSPAERKKRERAEYQQRREAYQRRKLEFEERRLEAMEKREHQSRQYQEMKKERQRLSAELRSLRATIRNERLSGRWDVLGY
ncbi:MAG: hypothetical protein IJY17_05845 [Alphaproteobacteria bacterium]|nr:hypothetical protein [Alphaproteobacteria bacterium]